MKFISHLQMPFQFDPGCLQADLANLTFADWTPHDNHLIYRGEWSSLALRNGSGDCTDPRADHIQGNPSVPTPLLQHCPYIQVLLDQFQCPLGSVRFLKVAAGAEIDEHADYGLCYELGEARFHIPVQTNENLAFRLNGERLVMREGDCWYVNVNLGHSVANRGATDRIHLVVDAGVNNWMRDVFNECTNIPRVMLTRPA